MPKHTIEKSFSPVTLSLSLFLFKFITLLSFSEPEEDEHQQQVLEKQDFDRNHGFLYSLSLSISLPSVSFLFLALLPIHALLAASIKQTLLGSNFSSQGSTQPRPQVLTTVLFMSYGYYILKKASRVFLHHVTVYGAISCFCFACVISLHFSLQIPTLGFLFRNTVLRHPT